MAQFIATFGYNHRLLPPGWANRSPEPTGLPLRDRFVRVEAVDQKTAMAWMFATFGQQWSQIYPDEDAAGVQRFNLRELVV